MVSDHYNVLVNSYHYFFKENYAQQYKDLLDLFNSFLA